MAEPLGDWKRTHTCGALRTDDLGTGAVLLGWVHRVRDLGGVVFIDIRDRAGISQVVVRDDEALLAAAKRFRPEYVIGVRGLVERRSADTVNSKLATGEVEVLAEAFRLLNESKTPPFQISEDTPVSEDVRLRYRYYFQTEADDYQEHYLGTTAGDLPEFRTQDSELASFDSHSTGVRFDFTPSRRHQWYLDLNYMLRSDDMDGYFASIGYSIGY